MCVDYHRLNAVTIPDRYPVPFIQDAAAMLYKKTIFSKLDFESAYNQIPIDPNDILKTAVITPFGLYEFTVMTFGLRTRDKPSSDLDFIYSYIDEILIASLCEQEHEKHLRAVFEWLAKAGLKLNVSKCEFSKSEIDFLGYRLSKQGIQPLPEKVIAIVEFPKPKNILEIRRFLGLNNFYQRSLWMSSNYKNRCMPTCTTQRKMINEK